MAGRVFVCAFALDCEWRYRYQACFNINVYGPCQAGCTRFDVNVENVGTSTPANGLLNNSLAIVGMLTLTIYHTDRAVPIRAYSSEKCEFVNSGD